MTDYDLVTAKLSEVGADFLESLNNGTDDFEPDLHLDLWNVHGRGLIVTLYENGKCGLYQFVGLDDDPVTKDLDFIERFANKNKESQEFKRTINEASKRFKLSEQFEFARRHTE